MRYGTAIAALHRRWPALLATGLFLLGFQATFTIHVLTHVHPDTVPTGHLPAAERDCVLLLHAGAVPEPPQDAPAPGRALVARLVPPAARPSATTPTTPPPARAPPTPPVNVA